MIPESPRGPIGAYRRYWLPELAALAGLTLVAIAVFAAWPLDVTTARWFYHPGRPDPWPVAEQPVWLVFYRSAPWLTGILAIAGFALLLAGLIRPGAARLRLHGVFLLLCVAIGPGIIINGILKDHWGRPRPRQIVEFGGDLAYAPPLLPSPEHGKSFPCGHCSVGYLCAAGWWLWRRSHPRRAAASLAVGLVLGTLLGFGRLAAGGHFLSDAVWAGLIALSVAHVLYFHVLRIPAREDARGGIYPLLERSRPARLAAIGGAALLTAGIVGGGILATPQDQDLAARIRLSDYSVAPQILEVSADTLDVDLRLVDRPADEIRCTGHLRGFGLPTNEINVASDYEAVPVPALRYRVALKGWFTDIDGRIHIRLPASALRRVIVRLKHGDITVTDHRAAAAHQPRPALDLHTADGRVRGN